MKHRQIMEAILEAHLNVEKYGETWYVLNDDFFSVVKESYFITDEGVRKDKPFVSLYNTNDKFYGRNGLGHVIEYVNGEVKTTSVGFHKSETKYNDFEQPYGDQVQEAERGIIVGHMHAGHTIGLHHILPKTHNIISNLVIKESDEFYNIPHRPLPKDLLKTIQTMDTSYDNDVNKKPSSEEIEKRRKKIRMKRKKKGKKSHRKK